MSNSGEVTWLPELVYSVEEWQRQAREQWRAAMMGRMLACMSIVSNYTLVLRELWELDAGWGDEDFLLVLMEAVATSTAWIYRWWFPMYNAFMDAGFNNANGGFVARGQHSQDTMRHLRQLLDRFGLAAQRLVQTIDNHEPAPEHVWKYFGVCRMEDVDIFAQVYLTRKSPHEILLAATMLNWFSMTGKDKTDWDPADDHSWRDFAQTQRQSRIQDVELYSNAEKWGLPETLGVVWLPVPDRLATGGTLMKFSPFTEKIRVAGTQDNIRAWYINFRQARFTSGEQDFLDDLIGPVVRKFRAKEASRPPNIDVAAHRANCFHWLYAEEAAFRNDVGRHKMAKKFPTCAFYTRTMAVRTPCAICQTVYVMDYPPPPLTHFDNPTGAEVNFNSHYGRCEEGLLIIPCMRHNDYVFDELPVW
ncbi:MAG: hypothetical protein Q9204_003674 [Flavoplaca sp. TL-2023a]